MRRREKEKEEMGQDILLHEDDNESMNGLQTSLNHHEYEFPSIQLHPPSPSKTQNPLQHSSLYPIYGVPNPPLLSLSDPIIQPIKKLISTTLPPIHSSSGVRGKIGECYARGRWVLKVKAMGYDRCIVEDMVVRLLRRRVGEGGDSRRNDESDDWRCPHVL